MLDNVSVQNLLTCSILAVVIDLSVERIKIKQVPVNA